MSKNKKKLKPEYKDLSHDDLKKLRESGTDLNSVQPQAVFAFTGDTQIEFLQHLKTPVEVLFMETTFIDELRDVEAARKWGHIHLDEWKDQIDQIPAKKIVLIHLSGRYNKYRALEVLEQKIDKKFQGKIEIFPRPF